MTHRGMSYRQAGVANRSAPLTMRSKCVAKSKIKGNVMMTQFANSHAGHIDMENAGYPGTKVNTRSPLAASSRARRMTSSAG